MVAHLRVDEFMARNGAPRVAPFGDDDYPCPSRLAHIHMGRPSQLIRLPIPADDIEEGPWDEDN